MRLQNLTKKQADNIINDHKWLVIKVANKYKSFGVAVDDLVSEGSIGLIKAVRKFDPCKNCSLKTYASIWIKSYIMQYIINNWSLVKIGTTKASRNHFLKEASAFAKDSSLNLRDDSGREFIETVNDKDMDSEDLLIAVEDFMLLHSSISEVLITLPQREKDIFTSRCLLKKPITLDELSKKYHISKERVRQIETKVFNLVKTAVIDKT